MSREAAAKAAARPPAPDALPVFKFTGTDAKGDVEGRDVYGPVKKVAFGIGKQGDVNLIEVDDETHGEVVVFLGSTGLRQGLVDGGNNLGRPVQQGDLVYIRFDGKEPLEGGKTFNHFAIHLESGREAAAAAAAPSGTHSSPASDDGELPF